MSDGVPLIKAYIRRYFKDEHIKELNEKNEEELFEFLGDFGSDIQIKSKEIKVEYDKEAIIKTSISYKKIEFLGFDWIWNIIENTKNLENLALDNQSIRDLGKSNLVRQIFPNVTRLSLM